MKAGDHVKFAKAHHAMNWELERLEGSYGVILKIRRTSRSREWQEALVRFDKSSSPRSWSLPESWIRMDRLEQ